MIWQRALIFLAAIILTMVTTVSPATAALTWQDIRGGNGNIAVSMINVGQGNCVVIGCPNGNKLLADCGSSSFNGT
ncbi:MAG: hypothetical protein F6K24_27255, partial [Okeania sp. SIO2D1]|nr:hypothetical protein [Okeania sp. SIO2D1]